jgi:hypothetical protein
MDNLLFMGYVLALIYVSYTVGKQRGTVLASERTLDIMIAMGYLEEKDTGEITKKSKDDKQPK